VRIQPAEDDARSRVVNVTDQGRLTVAKAFPAWRKAQARTASTIGADGAAGARVGAAEIEPGHFEEIRPLYHRISLGLGRHRLANRLHVDPGRNAPTTGRLRSPGPLGGSSNKRSCSAHRITADRSKSS